MMTLIIARSKAPRISSLRKTEANSGGLDTIPRYSIMPINMPRMVTVNIPISIAPGIFLIERTAMTRKLITASRVSDCIMSPKLTRVASLATIIPPLFKPINPIKRPTPQPIAILRFIGILSSIHCRILVILMIMNNMPAMKTAPRAISHE